MFKIWDLSITIISLKERKLYDNIKFNMEVNMKKRKRNNWKKMILLILYQE